MRFLYENYNVFIMLNLTMFKEKANFKVQKTDTLG